MKELGSTMLFFGIGSIALSFMNMQFVILSWIDKWGPTTGWAIKGGLIVVGAVLFVLGRKPQTAGATAD